MSITPFAFNPTDGLRNVAIYPTDPPSEYALRDAIQEGMDQLRDHINGQFQTGLATVYASKTQEAWIAPTLQNNWVNYGSDAGGQWTTAGYFKDNFGIVHLKGMIKSGTIGGTIPIFTLPSGYRPGQNGIFIANCNNGTTEILGRINIYGGTSTYTGQVCLAAGANSWISISGISFLAEV